MRFAYRFVLCIDHLSGDLNEIVGALSFFSAVVFGHVFVVSGHGAQAALGSV
jgi:hypothetical protein